MTVNDVAVAAITAAYRRLLLSRGEHPTPTELRIVIPVSTRTTEAKLVLDNRVSAVIAHLPIEVDHPVERLIAVHEQIRRHRSRGEADAEKSLLSLSRRLPFGIVAEVFRLAVSFPQRGVVALATDIPGPRHRLTLGGRKITELWPIIPIALRVRTTIAILSYLDRLTFGITGDYDTTPDIDSISASITTEMAVLLTHARDRRVSLRPRTVLGSATTRRVPWLRRSGPPRQSVVSVSNWLLDFYVLHNLPLPEVIDRYLAADVFWVTSLQDGMNLTAKEFVAAQSAVTGPGFRPGALVLSRYAGAATALGDAALLTDPNSPEDLTTTLARALSLDRTDRRTRAKRLSHLLGHDRPIDWATRIIGSIRAHTPGPAAVPITCGTSQRHEPHLLPRPSGRPGTTVDTR
ncbi:WS/DGAT domain-containing protein [Nocardia gipuzkoensis]